MSQKTPDLNGMLQAAHLLGNKQAVESIVNSQEARQLMELLNRNSGAGLKDAAQSAMRGDTAQLNRLVENLMRDPQSAKLMEELNKKVNP